MPFHAAPKLSKEELRNRLKQKESTPAEEYSISFKYTVAFFMGLAFGFVMEKAQVTVPKVIVLQMLMREFIMMKMFLSALGTSALVYVVLSFLPFTRAGFEELRSERRTHSRLGIPMVILGGVILGIGMSISGSCPGSVAVQLGAGVSNSLLTFVGGIVAAFLYGFLVEPDIRDIKHWLMVPKNKDSLNEVVGLPYSLAALLFGMGCWAAVFLLELYFPWHTEPDSGKWAPYISGAIVGTLQIPALWFLNASIGASTAYVSFAAHLLTLVARKEDKNLKYFMSTLKSWSPYFFIGAVAGGFFSALSSGTWGIAGSVSSKYMNFCGGMFLVIGARMSGGCTSGNGISGMSQLMVASAASVVGIFGGAIISAFFFLPMDVYHF